MKEIYIADAERHGTEKPIKIFVAVCAKQLRSKRDGAHYLALRLSDRSGQCDGVMWENFESCVDTFDTGHVVKVLAKVGRYNGKVQLTIERLRRAKDEEWEMCDFAPHTPYDIEALWAKLAALVESFTEPHLKALLQAFLEDEEVRGALRAAPAAKKMHHAWIGGLLEHVVSLSELCDRVAAHYPEIHRDLLLTGAMLHDIGKLEELRWGPTFDYTLDGHMLGHITLGIGMIERKLVEMPQFPRHLRILVEHLVLSHHGRFEFGSPKLPMTPEAMMLHQLDDLDAKLHAMRAEFQRSRENGRPPSEMTEWVRAIDRPLLDTRAYLAWREAQPVAAPEDAADALPAQN